MARLVSAPGAAERRAPLPPIARAPDVKDVLHLFEIQWFGIEERSMDFYSAEEDVPRRPTVPRGLPRGASSNAGEDDSPPGSLHYDGTSPVLQILSSQENDNDHQPRSFLRRLTSLMMHSPYESKAATPRAQADDIQPGLGTWAERQIIFTPRQDDEEASRSTPDSSSGNAAPIAEQLEKRLSPNNETTVADGSSPLAPALSAGTYSADLHEAWRWRFTRKWQMEQARPQNEVTQRKDTEDDDWTSALDYMASAAGGMNLQFARTTSLDNSASFEGGLSQSLSVLLADDASLPRDGYMRNESSGGMEGIPQATQHVVRAMKKAQELMACQQEIERQVAARWETTGSQQPWAAQQIPAVAIDSWGDFSFILARVLDKEGGRQKLLVRGRNRTTEQQAAKALEKEVALESTKQKVPRPRVEILGIGTMKWSSERDRCLQITGEVLHIVLEGRLKTKEDVGRVAGALTQAGLTPQHTVLVK